MCSLKSILFCIKVAACPKSGRTRAYSGMRLSVTKPPSDYELDCRRVLVATFHRSGPYRTPADSLRDAISHHRWSICHLGGRPQWDVDRRRLWTDLLETHQLAVQLGHLRLHAGRLDRLTLGDACEAAEWASYYLMPTWLLARLEKSYCGPSEEVTKHMALWCKVPEEMLMERIHRLGRAA